MLHERVLSAVPDQLSAICTAEKQITPRGRSVLLGARSPVASAADGSNCYMRAPPIGTPLNSWAPLKILAGGDDANGAGPRFHQREATLRWRKGSER